MGIGSAPSSLRSNGLAIFRRLLRAIPGDIRFRCIFNPDHLSLLLRFLVDCDLVEPAPKPFLDFRRLFVRTWHRGSVSLSLQAERAMIVPSSEIVDIETRADNHTFVYDGTVWRAKKVTGTDIQSPRVRDSTAISLHRLSARMLRPRLRPALAHMHEANGGTASFRRGKTYADTAEGAERCSKLLRIGKAVRMRSIVTLDLGTILRADSTVQKSHQASQPRTLDPTSANDA